LINQYLSISSHNITQY